MKFILADHTLMDYVGHAFEYARSIRSHAEDLGHRVQVLATRWVSPEVIADVQAIPCFKYGYFHRFTLPESCRRLPEDLWNGLWHEWNYRRLARVLLADLRSVEDRLDVDADTVVIFPTIAYNDILPIVQWAERFPADKRPWFVLVFHFTAYPDYNEAYPWELLYRRAFAYLEKSRARSRFRLFTDSQTLADEYRGYTTLPVELVPIPHAHLGEPPANDAGTCHPPAPVRLTYVGDARLNKGFQYLPYLFERLAPELEQGAVEADLQANVRLEAEWEVSLAVRRLRGRPGITLHENPLSTGEYYDLLDRAGIVLLPYTRFMYHTQTSGIFSEALARGKPVIVPRGTWMARELKAHGGGATFLPSDRQSLYETTRWAVDNYPQLRTAALEKSAHWRQRHCPAEYMRTILDSLKE